MTPADDPDHDSTITAGVPIAPAAVLSCRKVPTVLALRSDFLKAAAARRQGTGSFLLQARNREDGSTDTRVGFTASKKIGNAVARNRAKRRLRAIARATLPGRGLPGWDYVLVARPEATISQTYAVLLADLDLALTAVHRNRPEKPPQRPRP